MCLFPRSAPIGHKIDSFKCGTCPECLSDKSKLWALRCSFEAEKSPAMMMTLTYDNYIRDGRGNIIGEQLDTRPVSKRDCQLFIKRLRKYVNKVSPNTRIKYLLCAEYGKRTHRSHYHCIIFGYQFQDCIFYKRSKRGNVIYRSNTLEKIWHNGICTVDSLIVGAQVARYCTKYCAKDTRCDDTFMLFSRGIGDDGLHEHFNGKSYIIDGREYPIPRLVWQWYISKKYSALSFQFSTKYVGLKPLYERFEKEVPCVLETSFNVFRVDSFYNRSRVVKQYERARLKRDTYIKLRDNDSVYKRYLQYWKKKIEQIELTKPSEIERIRALPDSKYFMYKQKALANYNPYYSARCPRSGKTWYKWTFDWKSFGALPPCHKAPNDTKKKKVLGITNVIYSEKLKRPVFLKELAE